jgi:hypothetical protein
MTGIIDKFGAIAQGKADVARNWEALYHRGDGPPVPNFFRVVVLDVICDPTVIDNATLTYFQDLGVINANLGAVLPRNTIVGQRLLLDASELTQPQFFFPFLPSHISLPCKPGEHVWAFAESPEVKSIEICWWLWRAVTFQHTDDVNHSHAPRDVDPGFFLGESAKALASGKTDPIYHLYNGIAAKDENDEPFTLADSRYISGGPDAYEDIITNSIVSGLINKEAVPRFRKRPADLVFEGSNNQAIIFGTDRLNKALTTEKDDERGITTSIPTTDVTGKNTGVLDLVVGRGQTPETSGKVVTNLIGFDELGKAAQELVPNEGDIDYVNDRSRVLIANTTLIDRNFKIDKFNKANFTEQDGGKAILDRGEDKEKLTSAVSGDSGVVVSSDKVRIIARSDVVFYVTTYEPDGDNEGRMKRVENIDEWAAFAITPAGDFIFKPGKRGCIKLGGEDADKGVLVSGIKCTFDRDTGKVSGPGPISTMGGQLVTGVPAQGVWANRLLVKA